MKDIVNLINYEKSAMVLSFILCLCLVGPGALRTAYGQGAVETVGTMEISQDIDNGVSPEIGICVVTFDNNTKVVEKDWKLKRDPYIIPDNDIRILFLNQICPF